MMLESIVAIIFLFSFIGMGIIVFRKIPILVELPEIPSPRKERKLFLRLREKIKILNPFKKFSWEMFLQKILSKIRILSLKTENQAFQWLQKLRKRSKKETDDYWEKIKKSMKK